MIGPIAFHLCGPAGAGQAIGILFTLCSSSVIVGLLSYRWLLYETVGRHTMTLLTGGFQSILVAIFMYFIRYFKSEQEDSGALVTVNHMTPSKTENSGSDVQDHVQPGAGDLGQKLVTV